MSRLRSLLSRRLTAGSGILALVAIAGSAGAAPGGGAVSLESSSRSGGGSVCSRSATLTGVTDVRTSGGSAARDYAFDMGGSSVHQVVPPAGWTPLTATDQELDRYGLPARPADAAERAQWRALFANYQGAGTPGLCEGDRSHGLVRTQKDGNWAGGVLVPSSPGRNDYSSATLGWYQSGFHPAACGPTAAYSTWVGLGGFASSSPGYNLIGGPATGGLIQAGTDYYQPGNDEYAWWEVISTKYGFPEVVFNNSWYHIHPGDQMYATVTYKAGTASFGVYDVNTGYIWTASMSSYRGVPMSAFYDGTTADFITEAPANLSSGQVLPLAEPWTGNTYFDHATANNGTTIMHFPSWALIQATPVTHRNNIDTTSWNGQGTWSNYWKRCS